MKWFFIGREGSYYFWERDPVEGEDSITYQSTTMDKPPISNDGYKNLSTLLRMRSVTNKDFNYSERGRWK